MQPQISRYLIGMFLLLCNTVFAQLKADFTSDKTGGCATLAVNFTNTTTGASPNVKYKWDFGNGKTSTLVDAGSSFSDEKTYTVTLTATDGNQTSVKTTQVTVYKKPPVAFTVSPLKGCMVLPVTFGSTSGAGDGTIADYFWDFGDGSTDQGAGLKNITHTYNFAQTPNISLTVTNSYGCYNTLEKPKAVQVLAAVKPAFSANKTVLCTTGEPVTFTNTSTGPGTLSYSWDFGDGKTATDKSPTHTYDKKGIFTVKLTVKSTEGCTEVLEQKDMINVANYTVDFDVPALICQNNYIYITNTSTTGNVNTVWNIDGNDYQYDYAGINYTFYDAGQHTIKLTQTYGTCDASKTKTVTVNAAPKLDDFEATFGSLCGVPVTIQFKDVSTDAVKWLWKFDYNNGSATTQAPSYTFTQEGSHYVNLTTTNAAGCTSSTEQYYYIAKPYVDIIMASSTSPSGNSGCPGFTIVFEANSSQKITNYKWTFGDDASTSTAEKPKHTFNNIGTHNVRLNYTTENGCTGTADFTVYVYGIPKADFSVINTNICGNTPVQFNDNSSGFVTSWYWDFGDGSTSNEGYPLHQYYYEGIYTVTLVATNGSCSNTITKTDYIKVSPPFSHIASVINTCDNARGLVTFTQNSRGANSWKWDFGDGQSETFNIDKETVLHDYAATGGYKVVLTTTNGGCTVKDSTFAYVLKKQKPTLSSLSTGVCPEAEVEITVKGLEYSPEPYVFDYDYYVSAIQYGDGTLFAGYNTSYNSFHGTTYTTILSGFDNNKKDLKAIVTSYYFGCSDTTNTIPLLIKGPTAAYEIAKDNVCYKDAVLLKDISTTKNSAIKTWSWNFGDGFTSIETTAKSVAHQYADPGYYYPSLTVTDADGCNSTTPSYMQMVQVNGPRAAFTASKETAAPDETIYFYNNTNTTGSFDTRYQWFFGDGSTSDEYYPYHAYASTGVDTVKLLASSNDAGCTDTAIKVIYIKNVNTAFTFTTSYINNNSCPPLVARFQNISQNANYVSWDFGDGSIADNQDFPSHTYYQPGVYKVTLYGYGDNNVKDSTVDSITVKGPYATLASDITAGCGTTAIKITAMAKGATDYTWDFADGTLLNGRDTFALHTYTTAGVYSPALIMKDAGGCSSTFNLKDTIVIDTLRIKSINRMPLLVCDSGQVAFDPVLLSVAAEQMGKPLNYTWQFSENEKDTALIKNPQHYYNKLGTYPFDLTVSSPYGCTATFSDVITVAAKATAIISGPSAICESAFANFNAGANINDNVTWNWDFKNGNTSAVRNPEKQQYNNAGNVTVTVTTLHDGCYDTAYHDLLVHAKPVINIEPKNPQVCVGNAVQLTAHDGTAYKWSPARSMDDNSIANPVVTPAITTQYNVKVTNEHTCTSEDSVTVTVIQKFDVVLDPLAYSCKTVGVQLHASGAATYKWISGEAISNINIPDPFINPLTEQVYQVVGYDNEGCFTDTAVVTVQIKPLPTVSLGTDLIMPVGTEITLPAAFSSDVVKWSWTPGTYLSCTNCVSPLAAPRSAITYTAAVTNEYGCVAKDSVHIGLICQSGTVKIPTGFTPNNDNNNDWFCVLGKGIKAVKHIAVYGRWGQNLYERNNIQANDHSSGWDGKYNNVDVAPGTYVYIAEIICDTDEIFIYKGTITLLR